MSWYVCKCLICSRLFQGTDRNRGHIEIAGIRVPVEVCENHIQQFERERAQAARVLGVAR